MPDICPVCEEEGGLMINYAPNNGVEMMHPECAARHYQARVAELGKEAATLRELVSTLEVQAVSSSDPSWIQIPAVEWDQAWARFSSHSTTRKW